MEDLKKKFSEFRKDVTDAIVTERIVPEKIESGTTVGYFATYDYNIGNYCFSIALHNDGWWCDHKSITDKSDDRIKPWIMEQKVKCNAEKRMRLEKQIEELQEELKTC